MKELLYTIVEGLVIDKESIVINETTDAEGKLVLTLGVAKEDMGRVIGKQGKIIRSIRTIVRAKAAKEGVGISIEVDEAEE
ncbi:MAG: KH domain-containing protein [Ruminococcus sp.]|jgi:predicted RNA-binding protein YlqC (UPF0109 family)|nr:KH domain-containing protein [Ruminococcus sp.]